MSFIDRLNRLLGEYVCYLYLVAVVVTTYEVVMRYLFNAPTSWAFELTVLMCGICYLLSGGFVTGQRKHIAITALYDLASPKLKWQLDIAAMIVGIAAMSLLVWAAWKPAMKAIRLVERTGSAWDSPSPAIIKPMIAIGALLIVLQLIVQLYRHIKCRPDPWAELTSDPLDQQRKN
ncbi:MAG: TRAP transporter small permease [Alphaproteobacteria bacterium]|nr:TRAP transporter small permease [Alphaproteobacteria bacterium]